MRLKSWGIGSPASTWAATWPSGMPRRSPTWCSTRCTVPPARTARCRECWTRSEEHTSELQSLMRISYAVFCLKKKKIHEQQNTIKVIHHLVINDICSPIILYIDRHTQAKDQ